MRELTSVDLAWWRAWFDSEPRGEERDDWRIGDLACHVVQASAWGGAAGLTADDLRLKFTTPGPLRKAGRRETERRRAEIKAKLQAITARRGA